MAETKGLMLLNFWPSPNGMRCRVALAEKGLEYVYREEESILECKSRLLAKSDPVRMRVPVLLHDGKPVCESLVIVQYLDEVWPYRAPLLPADPYGRAKARYWADFIDKEIFGCGLKLWKLEGEKQEEARDQFIRALKVLEGELGAKKYFGGDTFGFVDIILVPVVAWYRTYELFGIFRTEIQAPRLMAWGKRCMERESVAMSSLPDPHKVYEFVCFLRNKNPGLQPF
ncbi:glutathione S-transferase U20-like [Musa acuminata AAA Group]|uniref:glutathione S-transferase U20-like n=1 Tax=Musa acuminata AAA Group TaxID=214697 RepID=UPI0031D2012F